MAPLAARGSSIKPLNELTATEIIAAIGQEQTTCEAVVHACFERIAAREPEVHAWAHLDPEATLAAARAFDKNGKPGPFAGVPFGVKDIIDTVDMPTEWGTPIHKGRRPLWIGVPHSVGMSKVSMMSLTPNGTPASGPR